MNLLAVIVICSPVLALVLIEAVLWGRRQTRVEEEERAIYSDEMHRRIHGGMPDKSIANRGSP